MPYREIIWVEGADGNVEHIAEHGIRQEEVEDVLTNPDAVRARSSSGRPVAFGYAGSGRYLAVVFEKIDEITVYPVTAFEVRP